MNPLPFRTLLYRYFFTGWLFDRTPPANASLAELDVRGWRSQQAAWLPTYVMRWFFCAGLLCLAGLAADGWVAAPAPSLALYAAGVACICQAMSIASRWVRLRSIVR